MNVCSQGPPQPGDHLGQKRGLKPPLLQGCKLSRGIDNYNLGLVSLLLGQCGSWGRAARRISHMVTGPLGKLQGCVISASEWHEPLQAGPPREAWTSTRLVQGWLIMSNFMSEGGEGIFFVTATCIFVIFVLLPNFGSVIKTDSFGLLAGWRIPLSWICMYPHQAQGPFCLQSSYPALVYSW